MQIKIQGQLIDVYKLLRDLSWSYPGMTLAAFLRLQALMVKEQEQLAEIACEIKKGKGEENGKDL